MFASEKYIRRLIQLVEETGIGSIEVSSWGRKVRITGSGQSTNGAQPPPVLVSQPTIQPALVAQAQGSSPAMAEAAKVADETGYIEIKSPMVGTFYAAPSPDSSAYVSLNEKVTAGQVVCIVEAMKLMNEIESEVGGRIVKILIENATPVEFDQCMFLVDPKG